MWSPKVLVPVAAVALVAAISTLPGRVAGAQAPSTEVLVPSSGSVSGTQVVLDASASAGTTKVQFELTGYSFLSKPVIATATSTAYGWVALWNSTTVPPGGPYTLQSVATEGGTSTTSPGVSIYVDNNPTLVLPSTASGTTVPLDVVTSPDVYGVQFSLFGVGCPSDNYGNDPTCTFTASPTPYGWIALWNSTQWANGTYAVGVNVSYMSGDTVGVSASVTVANTGPTMVLPASSAIVYGASQILDCASPISTSEVWLWVSGGGLSEPVLLGDAAPTIYGWLLAWDTYAEGNGNYSLSCSAEYPYGGIGSGPTIPVTVNEFYAAH